jgi:serine/threonine protein kinase
MLEPRQIINQCYILQERLGEDSFCELWRATSIYAANQFLLRFFKELPGIEAPLEEFRLLALKSYAITSPAVMDFVEVERAEGRGFIASEYEGQRNLRAVLEGGERFKLEHACRFVIELGQGLDAFHSQGIVFRCLNAENVLVTKSGNLVEAIRVQKPGYAPFLPLVAEGDRRALMENYAYVAPEAKTGGTVDRRSDIYSLGIHLFRFITGRLGQGTARARSLSISPSHVAAAFARRGVPEPVTLATLKAIRRNPNQRQGEVLELIAELRSFMDERRRELMRSGEVDPIAELATLNLGKDRVGATQAVKSLDTADYFRAISEAPLEAPELPASLFPVEDFADPAEVSRVEEAEAEADEDDPRFSAEDYLERAARRVAGESASRRPQSPAAVAPSRYAASLTSVAARDVVARDVVAPDNDAGSGAAPAPDPSLRRKHSGESPSPDLGSVTWSRDAAPIQKIVEGMESAFSRAFKGRGAFRFIQEPLAGPEAVVFARIFARFRATGLVADLGSLGKNADATDLLRALRKALAKGLEPEAPAVRRLLAKRMAAADLDRALSGSPLGALLLGADSEEPDPETFESRAGAMRVAQSLAALGRRRRPLVITLRGGELIGPTAHAILVELARLAPLSPLCVFAFYRPGPVPKWHVLSQLSDQ